MRVAVVQIPFPPRAVRTNDNVWFPRDITRWPLSFDVFKNTKLPPPLHDFEEDVQIERFCDKTEKELILYNENQIIQIINQLQSWNVDVAVFPECCLDPSSIKTIAKASNSISVVLGVGYLLGSDIDSFDDTHIKEKINTGNNCAIVIDHGQVIDVACKENRAPNERIDYLGEAMQGTIITSLHGHDNSEIKTAVRICIDFLIGGKQLGGLVQSENIDLIAVPAWSEKTEGFLSTDDFPRNALLGFANSSLAGGNSGLVVPGLNETILSDLNKTKTLDKGINGVVVLDYFGAKQQPSELPSPHNTTHVFAYASICHPETNQQEPSDATIIDEMSKWDYSKFLSGNYNDRLDEFLVLCKNSLLKSCIQKLAAVKRISFPSNQEFDALRRHIIIRSSETYNELLYRLSNGLRKIVAPIATESNDDKNAENAHEVSSYTRKLINVLVPYVRAERRTDADSFVPVALPMLSDQRKFDDIDEVVITAIRLSSFKSDDVLETFPNQLAFLKSFINTADPRISLQYTVHTRNISKQEPVGYFDIFLIGNSTKDQPLTNEEIEKYKYSLGQILIVTLSQAWNLSVTSIPAPNSNGEKTFYLYLSKSVQPPIAEDWGIIVDFLRTQQSETSLTLISSSVKKAISNRQEFESNSEDTADEVFYNYSIDFFKRMQDAQTSSLGFVSEIDRKAAGFLWRIALEEQEQEHDNALSLVVKISGKDVTEEFAKLIGTLIFGEYGLNVSDTIKNTVLSVASALRVFHPPYRLIKGRGLPNRSLTNIPYNGHSHISTSGILLGEARVEGRGADTRTPVFLPNEVRLRHQYIVGSTGSGKTNLMKNMIRADIDAGNSVIVLDPHGSLAEYCASHADREGYSSAYIDLGSTSGFIPNIDPFTLDDDSQDFNMDTIISNVTEIIKSSTYYQFTGPRFLDIIRLIFGSLHASKKYTLSLHNAFEVLYSRSARAELAEELGDSQYGSEWKSMLANQTRGNDFEEVMSWVASKLSSYSRNDRLRRIIGEGRANVSIDNFIARKSGEKKILAIRIPEWQLGTDGTSFIGKFILSKIRSHYFGKEVTTDQELVAAIYVDEFQKFASADFEQFLAESRKFGVSLTLANQSISQLNRLNEYNSCVSGQISDIIFANAGTLVAFNVGLSDRERLASEMGVASGNISNIAPYEAVAAIRAGSILTDAFSVRFNDSRGYLGTQLSIEHCINNAKVTDTFTASIPEPLNISTSDSEENIPTQFSENINVNTLLKTNAEFPFELNNSFLIECGISPNSKEESDVFLQKIYAELEMRVGEALVADMSDAQFDEFEAFVDNDENSMKEWFLVNHPKYQNDSAFIQFCANNPNTNELELLSAYGAQKWLMDNRPDYESVVKDLFAEIKAELISGANPMEYGKYKDTEDETDET